MPPIATRPWLAYSRPRQRRGGGRQQEGADQLKGRAKPAVGLGEGFVRWVGAAFLLVAMVLVAVPVVVLALARPTRGGDLDGFPREAVAVEGDGTEFVRVGDEGGRFRFTFCPRCGSTVFFYVEEGDEARIAIPVGAFADSRFPAPTVSVYEDRRHSWVTVPEDAEHWRRDPA